MYGFIYRTTNLVNGKMYVGLCTSKSRFKNYLGSGILLKQAIEKYGADNFKREILEECKDEKSLREAEVWWIKKFNAVESDKFYNLHEGGRGGFIPKKKNTMSAPIKKYWSNLTAEERSERNRKCRWDKSGKNNPMAGRSVVTEKNLKWYTNGEKTIYVTEGTQPLGYIRGRTLRKSEKV